MVIFYVMVEAVPHQSNPESADYKGAFVTLTYADAPSHVIKSDVQKFLKRFRQIPRDYGFPLPDFKYFFCAEYGSKFGRPHYHGLLFGVDPFEDCWKTDIVTFKDNYPIYSKPLLERQRNISGSYP